MESKNRVFLFIIYIFCIIKQVKTEYTYTFNQC